MHELWTVGRDAAEITTSLFAAGIELRHPEHGLHAWQIGQRVLPASVRLLGVDLAAHAQPVGVSPIEAYARQGDLVVTYPGSDQRPVAVQVYWRLATGEQRQALAVFDLEVSVQTPLLDSDPSLWTVSQLPASELLRLTDAATAGSHSSARREPRPPGTNLAADASKGRFQKAMAGPTVHDPAVAGQAGCWLIRPAGEAWSYAEMVHPADLNLSQLDASCRLRHKLFVSRLEKGVILRARVRGMLMQREGDEQSAAAKYQQFIAAPPHLTT